MELSNKNIVHIKKEKIEYIQFKKLLQYKEISHAYSIGTNLNFRTAKPNKEKIKKDKLEKALNNYELLCDSINCKYTNLIKPNQNHTKNIKVIDKKINHNDPDINMEKYNETDGLITDKSNIVLSTTNADCILLLIYDPVKKVIANVHSGWRGTLQRISIETIDIMIEQYECNPKDIICCICPSIRKCHFEVDKEVKELFEKEFKDLQKVDKIIAEKIKDKKWNIDTVLINQILLEQKGLRKENIIDSGICSVCNSNLIHSYRIEKEGYGLNTAIIGFK